ncbi:MAG TPA: MerR family transcriptional regulator [Solirubrobacteraceae bacterium]|nr:MerR family transcriptional regulator [Solirubrobacteraceae bacterium]
MTVAEAAAEAGVSAHTLRYYERAGLLARVERNGAGHRDFTEEDIEWVVMVTRLRATGMPIRAIREYAELVRAGEGNEEQRLALLETHRERVLEQLARIERNLELVDYKIGLYRDRLATEAIASTARS